MELRELIQLAGMSGDRFYHSESHFLHHNERVPLYQNFCYVLALLRTKQGLSMEKGFDLLERLLAFQAEGFPIYLDQYPKCYSKAHQRQILLVIHWIQKLFRSVMKPELALKLKGAYQKLQDLGFELPALEKREFSNFRVVGERRRRGPDPKGTFADICLGYAQGTLARWVREDPWLLIEAALIFPGEFPRMETSDYFVDLSGYEMSWGDSEQNHSLLLPGFDEKLIFTYPEDLPEGKDDRMEASLYLNYHPDNEIFVNGKKATTFQMGDELEIRSGKKLITLTFSTGTGVFFGHISRHSRPTQERRKEMFEAHDWRIGIRTIDRAEKCYLKAGLSVATPIA